MQYHLVGFIILAIVLVAIIIFRSFTDDSKAQDELDRFLSEPKSPRQVARLYERYVGHLFEKQGYDVAYLGALKGHADMGRDIIVTKPDEILVIHTKCWAKRRVVHDNDIYHLFGKMSHLKLTSEDPNRKTRAVMYSTSQYSSLAKQAASVLGVEIRTEKLNLSYPMIKCSISPIGEKVYYLPFDAVYDRVKVSRRDEYFVRTVHEAVKKGFKRAG
ncbi:restriction endonuclease [Bdellovibrio sp. SKB1291214]|uniref:restriction endonuclease n=1 Tax=Bdellovibrio sp. SKB1291214 TaxID=1732569 RepID=UPI000B51A62B|nr:restriction endonuclease [Bdellovibrio sp. SKB1291214]UYL07429.1 restriction endonuclease [Bdellovibrio sp. SKB1291214]